MGDWQVSGPPPTSGEQRVNRELLDEIVDERFRRYLVSIAYTIARDRDLAEGVVHDVVLAASADGSRLAAADDPVAYLRASVRRRACRRANNRERLAARRNLLEEDRFTSWAPSPHDHYFVDEEIPAALPRQLKKIYERRCERMTQEQIAEELGVSVSTVQRRLRKIKVVLRKLLRTRQKC